MKKYLVFLVLFLTGCTFLNAQGTTVERPMLTKTPIYGDWVITKCILSDQIEDNFSYKDLIGQDAIFTRDEMLINNIYVKNPDFKVKKVRSGKYLYKKYNMSEKNLNIDSNYVTSIYISEKGKFYYEIIKDNGDKAFVFLDGVVLELKKKDSVDDEKKLKELIASKRKGLDKNLDDKSLNDIHSGLLLGFKAKTDSSIPNWNYQSIYIKFKNYKVENVYELSSIIVPKKQEFAEIEVQRKSKRDLISDQIIIRDGKSSSSQDIKKEDQDNSLKDIQYVSSEYINIENINLSTNIKKLRLYFLDSYDYRNPLDIYHFTDYKYNEFDSYDNLEMLKKDIKNIGVYRDNGYWKLKGRLNYENSDKYKDFDLNLLPSDINKYNNLSIPMSDLKKIHSKISDAFIDPWNKLLITLENDKLKIYNIDEDKNISAPIYERELMPKSQLIMSEWAFGAYSQNWQKEISRKK